MSPVRTVILGVVFLFGGLVSAAAAQTYRLDISLNTSSLGRGYRENDYMHLVAILRELREPATHCTETMGTWAFRVHLDVRGQVRRIVYVNSDGVTLTRTDSSGCFARILNAGPYRVRREGGLVRQFVVSFINRPTVFDSL